MQQWNTNNEPALNFGLLDLLVLLLHTHSEGLYVYKIDQFSETPKIINTLVMSRWSAQKCLTKEFFKHLF
jgi:hypothetical protein